MDGAVAAVEVSTDAGITWQRATGRSNWTHTFSASGGVVDVMVRATDDSVNTSTAVTHSLTVGERECPCSIWPDTAEPTTLNADDSQGGIEVGIKFTAAVDGYITGLRYHWAPGDTGTHTGNLWTEAGALLATAAFPTPTTAGWQQVALANPVPVTAGTTYVASQYSSSGSYSYTANNLTTDFSNPPLTALANGGVYLYGNGGFPTQTFSASNYWVDVVFDLDAVDSAAPTVTATTPASGATNVAVGSNVVARFSEPVDPATVTAGFVLLDGAAAPVAATVTYDAATLTATLDPSVDLAYTANFEATISGVQDLAGNALTAPVTWIFTTESEPPPPPPPPDEGPGGPILVIGTSSNPFSRYYAEILRNEGLNAFTATDITTVTATTLADYAVVILGEVPLTSTQVTMFTDWVTVGGNLIAMRPDADLASLLGLSAQGDSLSEGYIGVDTTGGPGEGIVGETMQFHGTADIYALAGATAVAELYSTSSIRTGRPAVTINEVGQGTASAFTYDLARSVVYTRQGNPAWAGEERDGQSGPIRANDMFYPDYVDFDKIQIPQADEQQRLLANLVVSVTDDTLPMPRFWYFPNGERAAVVMTGDDHANNGTTPHFDYFNSVSPADCSVEDWECIRGTSYIYPSTPLTNEAAAAYEAQGFEVGIHVDTNCGNWTPTSLENFYSTQLASFAAKYTSVAAPTTHRTHCIAWSDWATQPKVELDHGIRLDTNYYYWPEAWLQDRPGLFTGSGMPMRFADLDGTIIDVYQATTQMPDESGMTISTHINTLLDNAIGAPGYYGAFTMNMHTDGWPHVGAQTVVSAAQARGVPVVSARQMLTWLDGRNASTFGDLAFAGGSLTFDIAVGSGASGLQAMVPATSGTDQLATLTRAGNPVSFTRQTVKGLEYAVFDAEGGAYTATYAVDAAGPTITDVIATPSSDGTATVTWTTDAPATSTVVYSTIADALDQTASTAGTATAHSVTLTEVAANATYHFRVSSTDAQSNTSTSPAEDTAPLSFTMPAALLRDTTVVDFEAGTHEGTATTNTSGGEVTLAPEVGAEFDGTALPSGWSANPAPWTTGGDYSVAGGRLSVDGTMVATDAAFGPGRSLEFVATFGAAASQHVGFVGDANFNDPWVLVSTGSSGNGVYARSNTNQAGISLGSGLLGSEHRYRIDWTAAGFEFYVDGATTPAATLPAVATPMLVGVSDFNAGGPSLSVDWLRMTPYATSGTFTSRVFDAGATVGWGVLTNDAQRSEDIQLSVRTGGTAEPDDTWSAWAPVANGDEMPGSARYLQYRASLSTADPSGTPVLEEVRLGYGEPETDTTAPQVVSTVPAADATAVDPAGNVSATFNEAMAAATIDGTSFTLRADGATVDVPAVVTYASNVATLAPAAALTPGTAYTATLTTAITDLAGNPLAAVTTWSFTTAVPSESFVDTTVANFGAGSHSGTVVADSSGGEVTLAPTVGADFAGTALPDGWESGQWTGGGATVATGSLTVDGGYARTTTLVDPGRALEFRATFGATTFQNAGFAVDFNDVARWAAFGIGNNADQLYAWVNADGAAENIPLGAQYLGSAHTYRIEWAPDSIRFLIDSELVHTSALAVTGQMRPVASELTIGGPVLLLDWLRMTPYAADGTFTSRVFSAGNNAEWGAVTYDALLPTGTTLGIEVRTGATATPDDTWSAWAPVASGDDIVGTAPYAQYRGGVRDHGQRGHAGARRGSAVVPRRRADREPCAEHQQRPG